MLQRKSLQLLKIKWMNEWRNKKRIEEKENIKKNFFLKKSKIFFCCAGHSELFLITYSIDWLIKSEIASCKIKTR